ncbi:recombinase family protein [Streptomyces chrestomyceticus]|uniref:recombinase family protein n=1 Tax=Streptomyces chrestomyceticus TaxID=68185 RepID=UPI00379BBDFD
MTTDTGPDPSNLIDLFCRKSKAVKSRTSASNPRRKQEISIAAQEALGRKVAALLGKQVRHVWKEVGSASRFRKGNKARDDQTKALAALEQGEVGALWCYRLDRWDRRGAGAILRIIEPEDGIPRRLLFGWDEDTGRPVLDSTNKRDRGELIRRAEEAREETERLSERVRDTKSHQRDNGEWINHSGPYGLKVVLVTSVDDEGDEYDERKLAIDDAEAGDPKGLTKGEAARLVFTLPLSATLSYAGVANAMNEKGIPSPSGGLWIAVTVRDMIHNPAYAGWQTTGRQDGKQRRMVFYNSEGNRVSVMHGPALVTDDEQQAAKIAVKGAEGVGLPKDGSPHDTRAKHRLSGLVRCPGCTSSSSKSGNSYRCWRSTVKGGCPAPLYVLAKSLDDYVAHRWAAKVAGSEPDDPFLTTVAERWAALTQPQATEDEKYAKLALRDAETNLQRLLTDRQNGVYDGPAEQFFEPARREALSRLTAAQDAANAAKSEVGAVEIGWLVDSADIEDVWLRASDAMKRDIMHACIDEIWVTKGQRGRPFNGDERVTIIWAGEGVEAQE